MDTTLNTSNFDNLNNDSQQDNLTNRINTQARNLKWIIPSCHATPVVEFATSFFWYQRWKLIKQRNRPLKSTNKKVSLIVKQKATLVIKSLFK
ncbi:hypothetical protein [Mycoplasma putrefaciens]|uniref:hypothetical protein n=1 Tax=Mycoplasma putrefaciens TaxID=2123 RepID=UPI0003A7021A|nr:hypothetical protein [Mycoplasma putrefaciens]